MRKIFILLLIPFNLFGWGKIGHRVVGEIAERQLTPEVREKVRKMLEGQSLAVVSTWADEMRSNPEFDEFAKWHYINLPIDKEYDEIEHTQENVVMIIKRAIEVLKSPLASREVKQFYLKYLIQHSLDLCN